MKSACSLLDGGSPQLTQGSTRELASWSSWLSWAQLFDYGHVSSFPSWDLGFLHANVSGSFHSFRFLESMPSSQQQTLTPLRNRKTPPPRSLYLISSWDLTEGLTFPHQFLGSPGNHIIPTTASPNLKRKLWKVTEILSSSFRGNQVSLNSATVNHTAQWTDGIPFLALSGPCSKGSAPQHTVPLALIHRSKGAWPNPSGEHHFAGFYFPVIAWISLSTRPLKPAEIINTLHGMVNLFNEGVREKNNPNPHIPLSFRERHCHSNFDVLKKLYFSCALPYNKPTNSLTQACQKWQTFIITFIKFF